MALLHEALYSSDNLAKINFPAYIKGLCLQLLRSFGQTGARVRVEDRIVDIALSMEQAVPCGLIINELVSNALKHGFPEERTGRVMVELSRDDGQQLLLRVSDDGVGLSRDFDPEKTVTLGLQLVRNLASQLGGHLTVESPAAGGTVILVTFPLPEEILPGGST